MYSHHEVFLLNIGQVFIYGAFWRNAGKPLFICGFLHIVNLPFRFI